MELFIDEDGIRSDVFERTMGIQVVENWYVPSGKKHRKLVYEVEVANHYLHEIRTLKAETRLDAVRKAKKQVLEWREREVSIRLSEARKDFAERAAIESEAARSRLDSYGTILADTRGVSDPLDWDRLATNSHFSRTPLPLSPRAKPERPVRTFLQRMIPRLYAKQELAYREEFIAWRRDHERYQQEKKARMEAVHRFRAEFEAGDPEAIREYASLILSRSPYPEGFQPDFAVGVNLPAQTLVVDLVLPSPQQVPRVNGYKVVDRGTKVVASAMKEKDFESLYEEAVKQTVLRTLFEVFGSIYTPYIKSAVVNGWTTTVNKATGHDETSCFISVSSTSGEFAALNLMRVDASSCIRALKGLLAGPLAHVAPVRPIMKLDTEDSRFVESRDVLAEMNSATNLAEIPWEDFEQLVRELCEHLFSGDGVQVRVTQASRDAGVDAIVFDPDPIRGGKFVVQAKRYTKVVPVSAVRDLYGTMINEGAVKGLLVTTAHYGPDSRAFAKDKPISLIDGSNLVHLLQTHGYKVQIDIERARALMRGGETS